MQRIRGAGLLGCRTECRTAGFNHHFDKLKAGEEHEGHEACRDADLAHHFDKLKAGEVYERYEGCEARLLCDSE